MCLIVSVSFVVAVCLSAVHVDLRPKTSHRIQVTLSFGGEMKIFPCRFGEQEVSSCVDVVAVCGVKKSFQVLHIGHEMTALILES